MSADLDQLLRLHAATIQGEWRACGACTERGTGCRIVWAPDGNHTIFENGDGEEVPTTGTPADAAFVVAAHNELPGLIERLKKAESEVAALRAAAAHAVKTVSTLCMRDAEEGDVHHCKACEVANVLEAEEVY